VHQQAHQAAGDGAGGRNAKHPGQDVSHDQRTLQGLGIPGEAHAPDGGGEAMRGRHRHAETSPTERIAADLVAAATPLIGCGRTIY
jgi:hypothetical protein